MNRNNHNGISDICLIPCPYLTVNENAVLVHPMTKAAAPVETFNAVCVESISIKAKGIEIDNTLAHDTCVTHYTIN